MISKDTITILKNFAAINGNLLIKPGNTLATLSTAKSVYATAVVAESFPVEFGIYDLNDFLSAMSLFESPTIDFTEKYAVISSGSSKIKFFSATKEVLTYPPKDINVPSVDVTFKLSAEHMNMIQKTVGVLRSPHISFVGDGENLTVLVGDRKNSTGNAYTLSLGNTDRTFDVVLNVDNFKMMLGDYQVELSSSQVAGFISGDLRYIVALDMDSKFE